MNTMFSTRAGLLAAMLAIILAPAVASADEAEAQIRVSGEAERAMAPDMAIMQLTVTREAKTAREALDANSAAMTEVIRAMRKQGVAERDLQTSNFSIQPRYVYPKPRNEKPPEIVGYVVRNSLTVRVRDLDDVGKLLDQSVTLGVNEGGNIQFTNEDPEEVLAKARAAAVKDALARAETLAEAADVDLGDILSISEESYNPQPYRAERMMASAAAADSVPVAAGENRYRVTVHLTIAIDQ
ncbi:SIMPL domain-containing protein [Pseudohalioglobus sediminis]|uniref:SIMPL domain-containing protein n=1 Tax=Pseudohalioglobus sediminis TaxID=2606449 RepID=A0A5B0X4H0_9GAMM|nr:SIMPL domain-containing protein [Pseudohalioglobus sediminis]KAA1194143.1 SIMPL domain-containing protein [Pseudohalioglobus sediminis]